MLFSTPQACGSRNTRSRRIAFWPRSAAPKFRWAFEPYVQSRSLHSSESQIPDQSEAFLALSGSRRWQHEREISITLHDQQTGLLKSTEIDRGGKWRAESFQVRRRSSPAVAAD